MKNLLMKKNNIIISNQKNLDLFSLSLKNKWLESLHIVSDFDKTLTKAFSKWKKRPSIISILRSENYLWEEYSKKAYELFDYYNPIEINPEIELEEKIKQMTFWRRKHLWLLVESKLNIKDLQKVSTSWILEFRDFVKEFLLKLNKKDIPFIILSANWLGLDSIKLYLEFENVLFENIKIVSNEFLWDKKWFAKSYNKKVIHSFNKWEEVLSDYPEIEEKIKDKKNIILIWDSLWDINMVDSSDYENLLKIWFYNEETNENLEVYKNIYDVVITWDWDFWFLNKYLDNFLT